VSPPPPRNLTKWERIGAGVLGGIGVSAGGFGVFMSSNQAGTTGMLVLGVVFALMAVQGTAVRKLGKEGAELADRDVLKVAASGAKHALEAEQPRPREAAAYLGIIQEVLAASGRDLGEGGPALKVARLLDSIAYERELVAVLKKELQQHAPALLVIELWNSPEPACSALVTNAQYPERQVAIHIVVPDVKEDRSYQLQRLLYHLEHGKLPKLVVVSEPANKGLEENMKKFGPVRFIHWEKKDDGSALRRAITELIREEQMRNTKPVVFTFDEPEGAATPSA
jgi:hypothetical protein